MSGAQDQARRIVVTGLGCISPLGTTVAETLDAAVAGRSGAGAITRFAADAYACRIAAEVTGDVDPGNLSSKDLRRTDRCVLFAMKAAVEALGDAKLEVDDSNRERIGVAVGSGIGGLGTILENQAILDSKGPRRVSPFTIPMGISNMPSGMISVHHGLAGPNLCHVSACATGAHAIGEGAELIKRGQADVMLVGGTEAPILGISVSGFASMKALTTRNDEPTKASRPFDLGRDGFLMGEGAAVLVLESLEHALRRGAPIRAEVLGYGASADASHMVAPDPEGRGAARCMRLAIEDSGRSPESVDYVNAHATSTPAGDPTEIIALRNVFGAHVDSLPVSATKSMSGHLLGAAGALEATLTIRALETGILPPTINLDDPDPACALDHVANQAREAKIGVALSNSFGFGGTNASLILGVDDLP
jgi:3-oxoacyl-[acyl-carrier-protein] synthase II